MYTTQYNIFRNLNILYFPDEIDHTIVIISTLFHRWVGVSFEYKLKQQKCLTGKKHERATEILWLRTYVAGSISDGDKKVFFNNLLIIYWTLNTIYIQFEYQCPK